MARDGMITGKSRVPFGHSQGFCAGGETDERSLGNVLRKHFSSGDGWWVVGARVAYFFSPSTLSEGIVVPKSW